MNHKVSVMLNNNSGTQGVWIENGKSGKQQEDVHVYVQAKDAVVIGHNAEHIYNVKPGKETFTDTALSFGVDNKVTLQYADEDGNVKSVEVPAKIAYARIAEMLEALKEEMDVGV